MATISHNQGVESTLPVALKAVEIGVYEGGVAVLSLKDQTLASRNSGEVLKLVERVKDMLGGAQRFLLSLEGVTTLNDDLRQVVASLLTSRATKDHFALGT